MQFLIFIFCKTILWKHSYISNHIDKLGYFEIVNNAFKVIDQVFRSEMDSDMMEIIKDKKIILIQKIMKITKNLAQSLSSLVQSRLL